LASRRAYRGIEEAALLGNFSDCGCPHTQVSRRLRYLYRESRDAMWLRISRASALASVYGNDRLDASKGYESIKRVMDSASNLIYYSSSSRRSDSLSEDPSAIRQVKLLRELRKNISAEMIQKELGAGAEKREIHVLGGR